ncbi:MAG TPA: M23 family metallopeptidase [Candidatus Woesebacteria bacterium]|nr:M23 family metallopeptidase [Candidatus Woesebacteria bacterium]
MFEKKRIKSALGGVISVTSLASGLIFLPMDQAVTAANVQIPSSELSMETSKSFANVLPEYTGVSQRFHSGHPGIDLTAPLGAKIFPIKSGVVVKVQYLKYDYGRAVWIDSGNDIISVYGHMGKIFVEEGDIVTTDKAIGEVGLTGKTTGPHLHLEILRDGVAINPLPYLALGPVNKR